MRILLTVQYIQFDMYIFIDILSPYSLFLMSSSNCILFVNNAILLTVLILSGA